MTRLNVRIENQVLQRADVVFAESHYTYDNLKEAVPPARLVLAKPGVDTELFRPSGPKRRAYILAVGLFSDPRKNVRLLFEGYKRLCIRNSASPDLVLAGTPPGPEDMEYMAALGIDEKTEFRKHPSQEELADLYRNAQFFVLSSDEEGLGIVILEAMASGLPVVSTDCGGPKTAVIEGETGFLTPVGDAEALADGMQHLLDDPELRQHMGDAGRQVIEENFSLRVAGKVYLDKYDELLTNHK
jgi:glycosyltransferase involved in cell wall biosynthesis